MNKIILIGNLTKDPESSVIAVRAGGTFRRKEFYLVGYNIERRPFYAVAVLVLPSLHRAVNSNLTAFE